MIGHKENHMQQTRRRRHPPSEDKDCPQHVKKKVSHPPRVGHTKNWEHNHHPEQPKPDEQQERQQAEEPRIHLESTTKNNHEQHDVAATRRGR